jgi:osmoprotectant transport system substrate-binding protein
MRITLRTAALGAASVALAGSLAACGSNDDSVGTAPASATGSASATVCEGVAGDEFVTLADDKKLQLSDNIIPVVRTTLAKPPLTDALNKVSSVLSQEKLNALNVATSGERKPVQQVAQEFVKANGLDSGFSGGSGTVNVVSAGFTENQTLAYIYEAVLDKAGYDAKVSVSTNRQAYIEAIGKNQYDLVPDYAASLTEFLNQAANGKEAAPKASPEIDTTVAALKPLTEAIGLTALEPADATDQNAFAVTTGFAAKYKVKTLSELAAACSGGISLGGPTECPQNNFCQPGLEKTYGFKNVTFQALDADGSLTRSALKQGKVALVEVFSSDSDVKPAT